MESIFSEIKKEIIEARKEVLVNKDTSLGLEKLLNIAKKQLNSKDEEFLYTSLGMTYLEDGNYAKAAGAYKKINQLFQVGYCYLLLGEEEKARNLWFEIPECEATNWGRCLIDLIKARVRQIPSFLQIRNHLESDIGYFIRANKLNYAEGVIKCGEVLSAINPESYKYIGRSLLYHDYPHLAIEYLLKGQRTIPQDPEIYYHLGQYSYTIEAYGEARLMLNQCIHLNLNYTPAKMLLAKVVDKINKKD